MRWRRRLLRRQRKNGNDPQSTERRYPAKLKRLFLEAKTPQEAERVRRMILLYADTQIVDRPLLRNFG